MDEQIAATSWEIVKEFFVNGLVPYSEYFYMIFIVGLSVVALWVARTMVSRV